MAFTTPPRIPYSIILLQLSQKLKEHRQSVGHTVHHLNRKSSEEAKLQVQSKSPVSKLTGLGIHTLRYYEHENLIIPDRNSSNRRCYSDRDIAWIDFIKRLKDTGMPIKEIKVHIISFPVHSMNYTMLKSKEQLLIFKGALSHPIFLFHLKYLDFPQNVISE